MSENPIGTDASSTSAGVPAGGGSGGACPPQIHWHEGLFLQPHHLQHLQRQLTVQSAAERRLSRPYPYGVVEASLSADALENMLVRFDRLRVIMPSGLDVSFPDNTDLPALDIKQRFGSSSGSFTICLAVPLWYATRGNTIEHTGDDDWQVKRLYRVTEVERPDENTGENLRPLPELDVGPSVENWPDGSKQPGGLPIHRKGLV